MFEDLFKTKIDRTGSDSLKELLTPPAVSAAGLVIYSGAEFDFPTCPLFSEGIIKCAAKGSYPFTLPPKNYGAMVASWLKEVRGLTTDPEWITSTHGTIYSVAMAIRMLISKGHRLITFAPEYSRYQQAARRQGYETIEIPLLNVGSSYYLDAAALEASMKDPLNDLLVFSHPHNPTGKVFTREELSLIHELSCKYHVPVVSDEIFGEIALFGTSITSYLEVSGPESPSIVLTSLGKCMSLTGINHANVIIKCESLRKRFLDQKFSDHYGSIDPVLYAGMKNACTKEGAIFVRELCAVIEENARLFENMLPQLFPGCNVIHPEGTFVIWVDYLKCLEQFPNIENMEQFHRFLEETCLFVGDRGEEYGGASSFVRYNLSTPTQEIRKSFAHIQKALGF